MGRCVWVGWIFVFLLGLRFLIYIIENIAGLDLVLHLNIILHQIVLAIIKLKLKFGSNLQIMVVVGDRWTINHVHDHSLVRSHVLHFLINFISNLNVLVIILGYIDMNNLHILLNHDHSRCDHLILKIIYSISIS